ncbi:MAG: diguanylate cyclase [Polyangiaceae bacterium]|nr:diguanylate cyclase [Polyangiaceae bacterium]MCW5788906.1 diguanylate cyclase [Polyangiaceae bacterium]
MTSIPPEGADRVEQALVTWVYPQRRLLTALVEAGTFTAEAKEAMLRDLMEAAVKTLDTERASVWLLRPDGSAIECLLMYVRGEHSHTSGMVLPRESAPAYFEAIENDHLIAAHEACTDPRTREFREGYLEPLGITSMLDAPVFVRGKAVAVVCYEHMGPSRHWHYWEELVASTFADFVALVFDAESQQRALAESRARAAELHRLVDERTAALAQSEKDLQALLDSAPIALALIRAGDRHLVYANQRANLLFEAEQDPLEGDATLSRSETAHLWVHPEDRERFAKDLLSAGYIEQMEVELRTFKGRPFWARMSAKTMRFRGELTFVAGLLDITERRRAAEALQRSENVLRTLLDAAPSPLLVTGADDELVKYANAPACALFEVSLEALIGKRVPESFCDLEDRRVVMQKLRGEGNVEGMTIRLQTARGRWFWGLMNARTAVLDGQEVHIAGIAELTAQKELEQRLRELATTDDLTGAHNRRYFFDLGARELTRTERYAIKTSLAMLDIDHFKRVNDLYGHAAGDEVLRELAAILREQVRNVDIVARLGGEEFVLLFPETPLTGAAVTVERIRRVVEERAFKGVPEGARVTVSIGLVEHERGESLSDMLRRADEHLYRAKNQGRNRVSVASREEAGRDSQPARA